MCIKNKLYLMNIHDLEPDGCFERWYAKMPASRQSRIDSLKPPATKRLSLAAGILLDTAMHDAGVDKYGIATGPNGKPYLDGHEGIFFNISHSGDLAALALSDMEIGTDIQVIRHFKDSLVNYVFNPEEISLARKIDPGGSDADMIYTRLWTMKEAVMKHSGLGISLEPKNIVLKYDSGHFYPVCDASVCNGYSPEGLSITEYELEGYALSVCSKYADFTEKATGPEYVYPG